MKIFLLRKKIFFLKIIHIFFLKNIILFSNSFATFEQSYFTNKTFDCSLFQRLKRQVLVSEESFVKTKRSLSFEISRYLLAFHEDQFALILNQYTFKEYGKKELKRITYNGNKRKLPFSSAKKQSDDVSQVYIFYYTWYFFCIICYRYNSQNLTCRTFSESGTLLHKPRMSVLH